VSIATLRNATKCRNVGKLCLFKVISKQLLLFRSSSGGEGGGGRRGEMFQTIYAHMNKWKKKEVVLL
jgi:hypothetical protein